jgi:carbamoyltransferase
MLLVAPVRADQRLELNNNGATGLDKLKQLRSSIPAITHVDYSARVQTVDADRHPRFHRILQSMKERTGCPIVINTSFNVRGEPIVCTPQDAYRCFMATNMDALVIGSFLMRKSEQPEAKRHEIDDYLSQFQLD